MYIKCLENDKSEVENKEVDEKALYNLIIKKISIIVDEELKTSRKSIKEKRKIYIDLKNNVNKIKSRYNEITKENSRLKEVLKVLKLIDTLRLKGVLINRKKILDYLINNKLLSISSEEISNLYNELRLQDNDDNKKIII